MPGRHDAGNDAFLLDALAAGGRRFTIVSPWVIAATMDRVGLLAAFETAVGRGAEIDVFADPLLNMGQTAGGLTQMEAVEKVFSRIGVRLHKLPKLRSKIVTIDTDVLCIGSVRIGTGSTRATKRPSYTEGMVAGIVQSSAGMGFGLVATPVLIFLDPSLVPGGVISLGTLVSLLSECAM